MEAAAPAAQTPQPDVPLSFNLIVRGNPQGVEGAIRSTYNSLYRPGDECIVVDTGSNPEDLAKIEEICKLFPACRLIQTGDRFTADFRPLMDEAGIVPARQRDFLTSYPDGRCVVDFAAARQLAADESKNEIIFWIDSDDTLVEDQLGALRGAVNAVFAKSAPGKFGFFFLDYQYAFGEDGTCTTTLRRERFIRKDGAHWKGACHETAIPRTGAQPGECFFAPNLRAWIRHTPKPHSFSSDVRNYCILRRILDDGDPRTLFYLGNAARGLERNAEAIQYYKAFDFRSGSVDDRFSAWYYIGMLYSDVRNQRPLDAYDAFQKCVELKPNDPRGYFGLARANALMLRWDRAAHWYEIGLRFQVSDMEIFSYDPTHVHYHSHLIGAYAYKEMGMVDKAIEALAQAISARPRLPEVQMLEKMYTSWAAGYRLSESIAHTLRFLPMQGGINLRRVGMMITDELASVPPDLEKRGIGKLEAPDPRLPRPNVAFFCGEAIEEWCEGSGRTGIGGSEKMVILLAEQLQKRGWNVTVYANVPHDARGISATTGVRWEHWSSFDEKRERDVLVIWRSPAAALQIRSPALLRILWCHDVINAAAITPDVIEVVDYFNVQSVFQAGQLPPGVPPEKVWVCGNGIQSRLFKGETPFDRDPNLVVFTSSPDRGLLTSARIMKRAKEIKPSLKFAVTYGFGPGYRKVHSQQNHGFLPELGRDVAYDEYERKTFALLDEIQAVMLGRIGWVELAGLLRSAGVWLYPTRFREISCMSAMEAQAAGCVVVATRNAALKETILPLAFPQLPDLPETGEITDEYIQAAAEAVVKASEVPLHSAMRRKVAKEAMRRFDIGRIAQDWHTKIQGVVGPVGGSGLARKDAIRAASPPELIEAGVTGDEYSSPGNS